MYGATVLHTGLPLREFVTA